MAGPIVKSAPYSNSNASPNTCALECQYNSFPSLSSNENNRSLQFDSSGLFMSQSFPSTCATNDACANFFEIPMAISHGVVAFATALISFPSGSATEISRSSVFACAIFSCSRVKYFSNNWMRDW